MTSGFHLNGTRDANQLHRFAHEAMATVFEIICAHDDRRYAAQAAVAAFDLVDRLERDLTAHRDSSDISRINRLRSGETAVVGHWTMECLLLAKCFHAETGGAFDVSLGSGLDAVELLPAEFAVRVHSDDVRLDLGGIGKGYAIDRARECLEEWDLCHALLHGGCSSALALEPPPERAGWPLTISLPGTSPPRVLARVEARRQAWSASGICRADHIVDPRSGEIVRNRPAAWVTGRLEALSAVCRAAECAAGSPGPAPGFEPGDSPTAIAEALSTAFMILSTGEIADCCRRNAGVEAWVLTPSESDPVAPPVAEHFLF